MLTAAGSTWGSPDGIAAIGTMLAFLIAAVVFGVDVRRRMWAQARQVYTVLDALNWHPQGHTMAELEPGVLVACGDVNQRVFIGAERTTFEVTEPFGLVIAEVRNGSDELISRVHVKVLRSGVSAGVSTNPWDFEVPAGPIGPGGNAKVQINIRNLVHPGLPSIKLEVKFRDSGGRWWVRTGDDPVKRLKKSERPPY